MFPIRSESTSRSMASPVAAKGCLAEAAGTLAHAAAPGDAVDPAAPLAWITP